MDRRLRIQTRLTSAYTLELSARCTTLAIYSAQLNDTVRRCSFTRTQTQIYQPNPFSKHIGPTPILATKSLGIARSSRWSTAAQITNLSHKSHQAAVQVRSITVRHNCANCVIHAHPVAQKYVGGPSKRISVCACASKSHFMFT